MWMANSASGSSLGLGTYLDSAISPNSAYDGLRLLLESLDDFASGVDDHSFDFDTVYLLLSMMNLPIWDRKLLILC